MKLTKLVLIVLFALSMTEAIGYGLAMWDQHIALRFCGWRPWKGPLIPKFDDNGFIRPRKD